MSKRNIIKRSFTLMDGAADRWFAAEAPADCGNRRVFVALGNRFGYLYGRTINQAAWELLLASSALDFAESREEFKRAIDCAIKTARSESAPTLDGFHKRMAGLSPKGIGGQSGWGVIRWS